MAGDAGDDAPGHEPRRGDAAHAGGARSLKPAGFGTSAVYWTTISTILGAILFLRLGYAVGHVGLLGTFAVILIGHLVTVPTSMAIAEIATNQRVEGGGVYFMLSRSFGLVIGGAIGIALYLSQAISISFYVIAFAEAFRPALGLLSERVGWSFVDPRIVSVPTLLLIAFLMSTRGANLGLGVLYVVVGTLFASLAAFFAGPSSGEVTLQSATQTIADPDPFFRVFAICFPAFTGLTAGVGLSGDLRDPKRAIPVGTLAAVATGFVVYVLVAVKLSASASPEELAADPLIMSSIAVWGPLIPIGLACASFSSALGSILIAPRTLQALAADGALPSRPAAGWLARTRASDHEPVNASLLTSGIALFFVALGDVDVVAQIISMFFMVTYGAICLVSFLERFASDPSYRPAFHSRWWISLFGALLCLWLMISISLPYTLLALLLLGALYATLRRWLRDVSDPVDLFQGAIFQISRRLQLWVQRAQRGEERVNWRPAAVCISEASFQRTGALDLLRWIAHRHGFATYIHFIKGYLSKSTHEEAQETLARLIRLVDASDGKIYVDTMVSPSYTSAFTQLIQLPGISGKNNNLVVFEYDKGDMEPLDYVIEHFQLATGTGFDVGILAQADRGFGYKREIHLWLTAGDYDTANLVVLLGYVIGSHPEWRKAQLKMFEIVVGSERERREEELRELVKSGRLPIAERNIEVIVPEKGVDRQAIVAERSRDADLTIIGFRREVLRHKGKVLFEGLDAIGSLLFVFAVSEIEMERSSAPAGVDEERVEEVAPEPQPVEASEPQPGEEAPAAKPAPKAGEDE